MLAGNSDGPRFPGADRPSASSSRLSCAFFLKMSRIADGQLGGRPASASARRKESGTGLREYRQEIENKKTRSLWGCAAFPHSVDDAEASPFAAPRLSTVQRGTGEKKVLHIKIFVNFFSGTTRPPRCRRKAASRPGRGGEGGAAHAEDRHKSQKNPLWERAQSSHSASGTPDAISGQSGEPRQ